MKSFSLILVAGITIFSCQPSDSQTKSDKNVQSKSTMNMEVSNKDKAIAVLESLETGAQEPIAYINPNKYIQHNLSVEDGLEGFGKIVANKPEGGFKAKVVRAFQDGDYVVAHTEYDFFGPLIGFDIFRFGNGLIVEHWDNLQPIAETTASGRSQIDGPIEITDLDKIASNKTLIKGFVDDVLMGNNPGKITEYVSTEQYDQHNPAVCDGLAALGEAIKAMAEAGTPMIYSTNHFIIGEGNFVFTASEGEFLGKPSAFFDLFRIEDGKIVEHWDTVSETPPKEEWKNDNGKF